MSDLGRHYILDEERKVVPVDMMTWAKWFSGGIDRRRVAETFTELHWISTVFLGIDHQWGEGPPILFETMVFEKETTSRNFRGRPDDYHEDVDQYRYSSWDDAVTGHKAMVRKYLRLEAEAHKAYPQPKQPEGSGR